MRIPIPESKRKNFTRYGLVYAATIVSWAILHDIFLVSVEPRHFTEYHSGLYPFENHILHASQYAIVATFGPGLVFGLITFCLSELGGWSPVSFVSSYKRFFVLIGVVELSALGIGYWSYLYFTGGERVFPYPRWMYPELSSSMVFTQSTNISAYVMAFACSGVFFIELLYRRMVQQGVVSDTD